MTNLRRSQAFIFSAFSSAHTCSRDVSYISIINHVWCLITHQVLSLYTDDKMTRDINHLWHSKSFICIFLFEKKMRVGATGCLLIEISQALYPSHTWLILIDRRTHDIETHKWASFLSLSAELMTQKQAEWRHGGLRCVYHLKRAPPSDSSNEAAISHWNTMMIA